MHQTITLHVNGSEIRTEADPATPLLYVLRNNFGLNGPKFGCGLEQCGTCLVLIDGKAQKTCLLPVIEVSGKKIITLEGLSGEEGLHPLQQAFIDEQAAQCGYCVNGMIIAAVSMLNEEPEPDRQNINRHMNGILCRCGTYARFFRAIQRVTEPER